MDRGRKRRFSSEKIEYEKTKKERKKGRKERNRRETVDPFVACLRTCLHMRRDFGYKPIDGRERLEDVRLVPGRIGKHQGMLFIFTKLLA